MNFEQEAQASLDIIFNCIRNSQNERIQNGLKGIYERISFQISQLSHEEEHLDTLQFFLCQLKKCEDFATKKGNLEKVWKLLHFKVYESQEKFIEGLKKFPLLIEEQIRRQKGSITMSTFLGESFQELFSHQLITFKIKLDIPGQMNDQDMDDCLGCITFISPETESSKLFSVNMKLEQIVRKVKKLETVLKNIKLDSTILKFKFDHNKQLSTLWSTDEKVSFLLTNRVEQDQKCSYSQRIYLDAGMIISLTKKFNLIVTQCYNDNQNKQQANEHFSPIPTDQNKPQNLQSQILQIQNQSFIELSNGYDSVLIYPNQIPIKLSTLTVLPKGYEIYVLNDGFGHYLEIVQTIISSHFPKLKSLNNSKSPILFQTVQTDFQLGIALEENVKLWFSSDISQVWEGKDLFDL